MRGQEDQERGGRTRSKSMQILPPSTSVPTKVTRADSLSSKVFAIHRNASFWVESSILVDSLKRQRRFDDEARMPATSGVPPRLLRVLKAWGASVTKMSKDAGKVESRDEPFLERRDMVLSRRAALRSSSISCAKDFLELASN